MSDSKDDIKDYETGYKKPPTSTQFKKGQSGNPKGRPKGLKNMTTIWNNQLNKTVSVVEQGEKRKIQKQEVIVTRVINKAVSGDFKAIGIVLQHHRQIQGAIDLIAPMPTLKPTDEIVQNAFLSRLKESLMAEIAQEQITRSIETKTSQESSHEND